MLDFKTLMTVLATLSTCVAYIPYLRGMFKSETKPHIYTWLIWFLTQSTAAAGMLYGGAGWAATPFVFGNVLVFIVFVLCFKYGSKNITRSDTALLVVALAAIVVWWQFNQPLISVLMVTAIDALGYIPTYRKLWTEPWSENLASWGFFILTPALTLLILDQYNLLTITYIAMTLAANVTLVALSLVRRKIIQKPT